jgi:hypothetical protein
MSISNPRPIAQKQPADAPLLPATVENASPIAAVKPPEGIKMETANPVSEATLTELERIAAAVDLAIALEDN